MKVDICRSRTCICRVARKPQLGLIDSNRRAPQLWRLDPLTYIVINQWNMVTCGNEMRSGVMVNEVLELE